LFYPANFTLSSIYFGEQLFLNLFSGDKSRPRTLTYYYKKGDKDSWQKDKRYGWKGSKSEEQIIPMIPVEFDPSRIKILAPKIIYIKNSNLNVPIFFLPPKKISILDDDIFSVVINNDEILEYEVRVSRETRGWDYDYRNYKYMPTYGKGDLKVFKIIDKLNSDIINTHFTLNDFQGDIFVEVIPKFKKLHERDSFIWPSYEAHIQIFPEKYSK
jgi:hypothetical protein